MPIIITKFDTANFASEIKNSSTFHQLMTKTEQMRIQAESYFTIIQENLREYQNILFEEYKKHKNCKEALMTLKNVIEQKLLVSSQILQQKIGQSQNSLVVMNGEMRKKIFLAQVTMEYVKNLLFNPFQAKLNIIIHENSEKIVVAFNSMKSLDRDQIKSYIYEKSEQFQGFMQISFKKMQVLLTFDKKAVQDNFLILIAQVQKLVQQLKEMDIRQESLKLQQKSQDLIFCSKMMSQQLYIKAIAKIRNVSLQTKDFPKNMQQRAITLIQQNQATLRNHVDNIVKLADEKKVKHE